MKTFLTNIPTTRWTAQAIMVAGLLAAVLVGAAPAKGAHGKVGAIVRAQILCEDEDVLVLGIETPNNQWGDVMTPFFMTGVCAMIEDGLVVALAEERETFAVPEEGYSYTVWRVEDIKGVTLYAWERHELAPEEGI